MKLKSFEDYNWPKTIFMLDPESHNLFKATCEVGGLRRSQVARALVKAWLRQLYDGEWTQEKLLAQYQGKTKDVQLKVREAIQHSFRNHIKEEVRIG